ncbi:MAG: hypothetical protein F6J90_22675 [Moorea sp. SIOASIH]|uniref:hypothetical protein n=1 Tax=Moorena sp. SIOASIH TaxID=2607817 RepID=UPI0013BABD93|nr:hypothetical protein [Moorena sp. SIOASIH]NEO38987.1 hypothetical protein [Moorena sp. SIOASIH]
MQLRNRGPKLHRFLIPHTPHPTPHTPHLTSLLKTYPCEESGVGNRESGVVMQRC